MGIARSTFYGWYRDRGAAGLADWHSGAGIHWNRIPDRVRQQVVDTAPDHPDTAGRFYADVQMYANSGTGVDPENYMGSWITAQIAGAANSFLGRNVQRFQSDEYDRLYAELQNTADVERRNHHGRSHAT